MSPLILVVLGSCSGVLPSSAIPEGTGERAYGLLTPTTALPSLIRDRDIRAPDPAAPQPLLQQLVGELAKSDPDGKYAGVTYDLTGGNVLPRDWLVQSPNRWGRASRDLAFYPLTCKDCEKDVALPSCSTDADCGGGVCGTIWPAFDGRGGQSRAPKRKVCLGHSDALIERVHDLISEAKSNVDVTLLQPAPDTRFLPESALERLVDFLETRTGDIYIVLSNPGAIGNGGNTYYTDVPMEAVARRLRQIVQKRFEARDPKMRYEIHRGPDPVNALLCSRVHLAPFRFGPDASWPSGKTIANHSKFWMIDDRAFYIGSDNMHPVNLQEFGYIVDDRKAAAEIVDSYWAPLWQWSQRAAVSGTGVDKCIFREVKQ